MTTACGSDQSPDSGDTFVVNDNTIYESREWDDKVNKVIEYIVGDAIKDVPTYRVLNYKAFIDVQTSEDTIIKSAHVYCYPVSEANAQNEYETKLKNNGYVASSESSYAFYKASKVDDVYAYYDIVKAPEEYAILDLSFYRVTNRYDSWNNDLFRSFLGFTLPSIEAESYEYYYTPSAGTNYPASVSGYANVVGINALNAYKNKLLSNGFTLDSSDAYYYRLVKTDDHDVSIMIGDSYSAYDEAAIYFKITNAWPYLELTSVLGKNLPKLNAVGTYSGYEINQLQDGSYYLAIYYDNVNVEAYQTYDYQLRQIGLTYTELAEGDNPGSYTSSNPNIGLTYYSYFTSDVSIFYYSNASSLYIIVYM